LRLSTESWARTRDKKSQGPEAEANLKPQRTAARHPTECGKVYDEQALEQRPFNSRITHSNYMHDR
jgi:hypothetical protein